MKKQILVSLLALVMVFSLLPVSALAADSSEISIAIDDTSAVAEYEFTYYEYDYNLASAVKHAVETKAADAGITVSDINKLTISTSGNARVHFADCRYIAQEMTGLTTLDITNADFVDDGFVAWSLDSTNIDHKIPIYAFDQASQIQIIYPFSGTSRDVSTKFTAISSDAFAGTGLCGEIMIPKTVVEVSGFNKTQITGVNKVDGVNYLDGNIETIGGACFLQTSTLTGGIVFGEKVTSIGWGAFSETQCSGDIVFGGAIKEIGNQVLRNCKEITSVRVGSQVTSCSTNSSFVNCTKLESVIFEDGAVATIGPATFNGCNSLDYIYFGDKCTLGSTGLTGSTNIVLAMEEEATNGILNVTGGIVYVSDYSVLKNMISTWHINPANLVIADLGGGRLSDREIFPENTLAIPSREGCISGGWYEVTDPKATDWTLADAPLGESSVPENGKVYLYKWTVCSHNVDKAYTAEATELTQKCSACGHVFGTATLTAPENLAYDGSAKEAAVTTANGWEGDAPTIEYYAGEEKLTGAPTDAGDYTAKITAGGATASLTFTIAKARYDMSGVTFADVSYPYDGNAHTLTISGTLPEGVTVTYSNNTLTNAGTITATASFAGDATNYGAIPDKTATLTITQTTPEVTIIPSTTSLLGGGTVELTVSGVPTGGIVTVTQTDNQNSGSKILDLTTNGKISVSLSNITAAYTFTVTYAGDANHTGTTATCIVTVNAAPVVAPSYPVTVNPAEPPLDPVKDCPRNNTCPASAFGDLNLNSWNHDGIHYCVEKGLMKGITSTEFAPAGTVTRAMLVTILYRHAGSPAAGSCNFTDVAQGAWYTDAIAWAAEKGIVKGYSADTFGPMDPITREQMAAILYRYACVLGQDVTGSVDLSAYTDGNTTSDYAKATMAWCVKRGILNGYPDGTIKPTGTATREQVATVLMRFCEQ